MNAAEETLPQILQGRAKSEGDRTAYTFLADGATDARTLSWAELHRRASARAAALTSHHARGKPVLLMLPSGLEFIESLFACFYAGAIAVPMSIPRHHRLADRLHEILTSAGADLAIGNQDIRNRLAGSNLRWIEQSDSHDQQFIPPPAPEDIAVLQYTSGSTGSPRGVVITHANLTCNSALIAEACGHGPADTIGGWLPLFHDMGLVGLVIQAAFTGAHCVFMAPERFLMRPWQWLQMISKYKIRSSPAPNFAYDLCVEKVTEEQKATLDLSQWANALNGSEPVRAGTLDRFSAAFANCGFKPHAFFPCYGLAEATLFVTGPSNIRPTPRHNHHVGCGRPLGDTRITIVDPLTRKPLPDGQTGEIWITGGSCAKGYWKNPEATEITFRAKLNSEEGKDHRSLATGDLGVVINGELFITGRLRELIIIAGRNFFPVDLERSAEAAHRAVAVGGCAAFSIDTPDGERLILAMEVNREYEKGQPLDTADLLRKVRSAVVADHEIAPHEMVLLRPGALPRTTSGKLKRTATRQAYLNHELNRFEERVNGPAR